MKIHTYKKYLIIAVPLLIIVLIILSVFLFNKKSNNEYSDIKNSIEHIFYYLDKDDYKNMNDISDFCKLALVYDSSYLSSDEKIYDTDGKSIDAYTKEQVMKGIKSILGKDVNFNFQPNDDGTYNFLISDKCMYGNINASNLSYDSARDTIYSNGNMESNYYLEVKWSKESVVGNKITLNAQALMIVKSDDGYNLFVDSDMKELLGSYKSLKEAKKAALEKMNYSYDYEFILEKEENNIIWKSFKRIKLDPDMIVD